MCGLALWFTDLTTFCRDFVSPLFILFLGNNGGIGVEGWAAVGKALLTLRNLKKLDLGEREVGKFLCRFCYLTYFIYFK